MSPPRFASNLIPQPYVSRGGLKLEKALEVFAFDVTGWVCLDIGASTGGFADCVLQKVRLKRTRLMSDTINSTGNFETTNESSRLKD